MAPSSHRGDLAQLHLRIAATEAEQPAIGLALRNVSGAVDAAERRMMGKALRRERRLVPVAAGEGDATEHQFALGAIDDRLEGIVDDPRVHIRDRRADGYRPAGFHAGAGDGHGALGGAITIDERAARGPAVGDVLRERLAADVEEREIRKFARGILAPRGAKERGWRAEDGNAFITQPADDVRAKARGVLVHHDDGRPGGEGEPCLLDRRVVGGGRSLHGTVVRREAERLVVGLYEVADAPVLDHHALGAAGAAGGIDDVGERRRREPRRTRSRQVGGMRAQRVDDVDDAIGREPDGECTTATRGVSEEGHRVRVVEGVLQRSSGKARSKQV